MKTRFLCAWLSGLLLLGSGCMSTIPFKVGHEKLKAPATPREGAVGLKALVDSRPGVTNALQIGGKWEKAQPVYVAAQGRPVAEIVTDGLQEALELSGYKYLTNPEVNNPVIEGELIEFWLTDNWNGAICKIGVRIRLRRSAGGEVLWEKTVRGEEDDWAIIPNAMRAALTTLLQKAVEEFSSPAFAGAVAGQKQAF